MPKVSEEYFEKKRQLITEAAYQLCLRKPVEMITISDVISEAGLSQGAIYRYYDSLDDILADVLTRVRSDYNIIDKFKNTIESDKSFEEITYEVCDVLADAMKTHLMDVQKINFDVSVLAINEPERAAKITAGIKGPGNLEYLGSHVLPKMMMESAKNGLKPRGTLEEIQLYLAASYVGIEKYCIMAACYGTDEIKIEVDPHKLFRVYAKTIIMLFGGNIDD